MIATTLSREAVTIIAERYLEVLAHDAGARSIFTALRSDTDVARHISIVTGKEVLESDVTLLAEYIASRHVLGGVADQHPAMGSVVFGMGAASDQHPAMGGIIEGMPLPTSSRRLEV